MIIGQNIRIQGTIDSTGEGGDGAHEIRVRGRVEGTVRLAGVLVVEPEGWFVGEAHVFAAEVHGTVRGNITARDSIEVARTGRMIGDAVAPRVTIAAGAGYRGRIEMGDLSAADVEPTAARPVEIPSPAPAPPPPSPLPPTGRGATAPARGAAAPMPPPSAPKAPPGVQRPIPPLVRPRATLRRRPEE